MKRIIGVTGGVGSGKSTVLKILEDEYEAQILSTDQIAKDLMKPGAVCYQPIIDTFGQDIVGKNGYFDTKKLGQIAFNDKDAIGRLNAIVHPRVVDEVKRLADESPANLVVVESALLIESGINKVCDEVWYVYVSTQERAKRLYEQRGYSEVKSYSIFQNQLSHEEFSRGSDRLIDNESSREYTRRQIREIMSEIYSRGKHRPLEDEEEGAEGR